MPDAFLIEGFQQVIDRIYFKRTNGISIEGSGENDVGERRFPALFQQLFEYRKAVESGICTSRKTTSG